MPRFSTIFVRHVGSFSTNSIQIDAFNALKEIGASDLNVDTESENEVTISYNRPTSEVLWVDFHKHGVTNKAWSDNK